MHGYMEMEKRKKGRGISYFYILEETHPSSHYHQHQMPTHHILRDLQTQDSSSPTNKTSLHTTLHTVKF
jgi:hypothetical protein